MNKKKRLGLSRSSEASLFRDSDALIRSVSECPAETKSLIPTSKRHLSRKDFLELTTNKESSFRACIDDPLMSTKPRQGPFSTKKKKKVYLHDQPFSQEEASLL